MPFPCEGGNLPPRRGIDWHSPGNRPGATGKRGIVLHINATYEHTPILPYADPAAAGGPTLPPAGCAKTGTQCVSVSTPVVLTPVADVGAVSVSCAGEPAATCTANAKGTACTVTLTQRLCVSIPITFGVDHTGGEPSIGCAACADGECAPCGCGQ